MNKELTHIDNQGNLSMVDVSDKDETHRIAVAKSAVHFTEESYQTLSANGFNTKKGSLVQAAILAGIGAAKQTSSLIPLCHNIPISKVAIEVEPGDRVLNIQCKVKTYGKTGVEMEALTGASVAALCIYDMCKALSQEMEIGPTFLDSKTGGKNDFTRK